MTTESIPNEVYLDRLALVQARVATAVVSRSEFHKNVSVVVVGKGHPASAIRQLYTLGLRDFAENYAQEFLKKHSELSDLPDIRWHFIGHLQSNKAKKIAQTGCLIHSVDRLSVVNELLKSGTPDAPIKILVQMQVDPTDTNKSGCPVEEAGELCNFIAHQPQLSWEGFMGIGPADCSSDKLQLLYESFCRKADLLWEQYSLRDPSRQLRPMNLSLGMSDDLEIAIRCGATHIRIGSAVMGPRPKKPQAT